MPQIIPAILENTKAAFVDTMSREIKLPGVERLQVDFGDGIFLPNNILSVEEIDTLNPAFHWEAHLMLKNPQDFLDYQICGFKTIIVHWEAFPSASELKQTLEKIKSMGLKTGVAINPETSVTVLKDVTADQYLVMSVNPGFQGQAFLEESYNRIAELRKLVPNAIIEVDGGINLGNIKQVVNAGADLIIAGSALTKAGNMGEAWEKLGAQLTIND